MSSAGEIETLDYPRRTHQMTKFSLTYEIDVRVVYIRANSEKGSSFNETAFIDVHQ